MGKQRAPQGGSIDIARRKIDLRQTRGSRAGNIPVMTSCVDLRQAPLTSFAYSAKGGIAGSGVIPNPHCSTDNVDITRTVNPAIRTTRFARTDANHV